MSTNPSNHLPPLYDDIHPVHYDPSFTEDISTKMRVPHKLAAFDDDGSEQKTLTNERPGQPMVVPERILVAGQDQHIGMREDLKLDLDGLTTSMSGGMGDHIPVGLTTPPRTLTVEEHPFPTYEETPIRKAQSRQGSLVPNGYQTPRQMSGYGADLLATPGDGLLINEGDLDDIALLRRQVSKLTRHVIHLEEENTRRFQREVVLYPILGLYALFQIAKFLLRTN